MEITYFGHSSFRIKGKTATLITDPYDSSMVGLKFPKHTEADIVTVSHAHQDHNAVGQIDGSPFIITGPGEYEVKGIGILGISSYHDGEKGEQRGNNTMYRIEIDGISIVHLGDLGHTLPSSKVDELGNVNILLIPVGGVYTIDAQQAAQVVQEVEPNIVIPMHYGRPELMGESFSGLALPQVFLKELGKEDAPVQQKLSITKDKIPAEMQAILLQ